MKQPPAFGAGGLETRNVKRSRAASSASRLAACAVIGLLTAGCQLDHAPRIDLGDVQRPETAVVLISADGVQVDALDHLLEAGGLPNIQWMIDNGVRVRRAVSGYPTVTYAQYTSVMTGRYPGHTGILGNKWFDRYQLVYYSYNTTATYRDVDRHFHASTIYERLPEEMTVNIQNPVRRGVTRTIDNWAVGGIRWFFQQYHAFDSLMPSQFELIGTIADETGRWPVLIHAYHPALDEIGHRHGPDSESYRDALRNLDRQVGRIRGAVESARMANRSYFVFFSDHGFVSVPRDHHFNVSDWLRVKKGRAVTDAAYTNEWFENRYRHFMRFDAVVINGGNRRAAIHLRGPDGWFTRPAIEDVRRIVRGDSAGADRNALIHHEAVQLAAYPVPGDGGTAVIELASRHGISRITRRHEAGRQLYRYDRLGGDALGDWADEKLSAFVREGWHDEAQWLAATIESPFPDITVQMVEMFASPRAGDLVLFAEPGWDFGESNRGGHGGITRADMYVPLIFVGPDIPKGRTIPLARLVDVTPTVLHLIRRRPAGPDDPPFDGVDRTREVREAGASASLGSSSDDPCRMSGR